MFPKPVSLLISQQWQEKGFYNDTIEVTVNWSRAAALYDAIRAAVPAIRRPSARRGPLTDAARWPARIA